MPPTLTSYEPFWSACQVTVEVPCGPIVAGAVETIVTDGADAERVTVVVASPVPTSFVTQTRIVFEPGARSDAETVVVALPPS